MKLLLSAFNLVFLSCLWGAVLWSPPNVLVEEDRKDFTLSVNNECAAILGWIHEGEGNLEIAEYDFFTDTLHIPRFIYPCAQRTALLQLILADNKDIFALWRDEEEMSIKAAKYIYKDAIWSDAICLHEAGKITDPVGQIDGQGNIMIVWRKYNGYEHQIQAVGLSSKTNKWSAPTTISPVGYDCSGQKFGFDSQGNCVAAWKGSILASETHVIQAVQFDAEKQKWSNSLFFSDFTGEFTPVTLDLVFDVDDNLIILWNSHHHSLQSHTLQFISYNSSEETWGNKTLIEAHKELLRPHLVNTHHAIYAIWLTSDGQSDQLESQLLRYPGSHLPEKMEIFSSSSKVVDFKIKADHFGKITLFCTCDDQLRITHLDGTWEDSAFFTEQPQIKNLQIEGDALGNMLVMWEADHLLFYARGNYLLPPSSFSARVFEKRLTTKSVLRAVLNWTTTKSPSVRFYRIRRNEELIAELPASQAQFVDKWYHRYSRGKTIYTISSINDHELESQVSEFIIEK